MSTVTTDHAPQDDVAEPGSNSLLYALGAAMFSVSLIVCVLITEATLAWLIVAFASLLVAMGLVGSFILKFIDADH